MTRVVMVFDPTRGVRVIVPVSAILAAAPDGRVCVDILVDVDEGPGWYRLEDERDLMQALGWTFSEPARPAVPPTVAAILDVISRWSGDGFWMAGCGSAFWSAVRMWNEAGRPGLTASARAGGGS